MQETIIKGIKVAGMAAAVSSKWTAIKDLMEANGQGDIADKFTKKTGVVGRYDAGIKQTTSDFCYAAAKELLERKNINPNEVGVLVFVTQTPDYGIPATACVLQKRLGLSTDCIAFDVNLGCSGFSYGVNIASSILQSSSSKIALLLCGDTSAKERLADGKTKTANSANYLFGDSGTATLLIKEDSAKPINMLSKTDGDGYRAIISPYAGWKNPTSDATKSGKSYMDDVAVLTFAIDEVPKLLISTMEMAGTTPADYKSLVLHQANLFIMKTITKRAGFGKEQMLLSIDKFGNTSSSSIPISIVKDFGDDENSEQIRLLCCGFGVGLSWSTVDMFINPKDVLPLIHTDEYYVDDLSSIEA